MAATSGCIGRSSVRQRDHQHRRAARQQQRFDLFREEYNAVRPHEALADATPASVYTSSPRPFPSVVPPIEYPPHFEVRLVSANGGIKWEDQRVNVSHVLAGEYVGLEEIDDGEWNLYFGRMKLGRFHERLRRVEDAQGRLARKRVKVYAMFLGYSVNDLSSQFQMYEH